MAEAPRDLVALRDRRERVISRLTEGFAADVLDLDEFDSRVDRAHRACSLDELDALVVDLPVAAVPAGAAAATALAARRAPAMTVRDDPSRPAAKKTWLVLSGLDRKGPWTVPRKMDVHCFWGGGVLDYRDADFGPGVSELHVIAVMGGLQLVVPPWLAVDVEASAIMGGFDERHRAPAEPDPGRPVLRITGFVFMGGVSIETRLPGESSRDARKREKRENKELRAMRAAGQLPPVRAPAEDER